MLRYFRLLVSILGLASIFGLGATGAAAQEFPAGKPIKLVIPAAAGTQADVLSRVFIDRLRERLNWTIVPDFRAGGDMVPAINVLLQSPADGYTVLLNYMALTIQAAVKRDLPYDVRKDFIPLVRVASVPNVVFVSNSSPFKTLQEMAAASKAKQLTVAGLNSGSSAHLAMELLRLNAGLNTLYVSYKDQGVQLADALAGRVDMANMALGYVQQHINDGRVRALAYTGAKRFPTIPNVPTLGEVFKDPELDLSSWYGFFLKSGTPRPIVDRVAKEIATTAAQPDTRAAMEKLSLEPINDTQETFAKRVEADLVRWDKTVREGKLKFE